MVKLPDSLKGFKLVKQPPFNPAFINGQQIDFNTMTVAQAEELVEIQSPYIERNETVEVVKSAKNSEPKA